MSGDEEKAKADTSRGRKQAYEYGLSLYWLHHKDEDWYH
jgi:hypothetical protein